MLSEYGVYREGICCFTLIKSSHEDEGRWGYTGLGDMRVDVRKGMNMEEQKGGQKRGKKKSWRRDVEKQRQECGWKNSALFLSGRPMPQQRSERKRAAETNRDGEERAGTREHEKRRGNRTESEHDKK